MDFQELIWKRRSIRSYDPEKKATKEQIEEIIKAAQMAPTWRNTETGKYYVLYSDAALEELRAEILPEFNQNSSRGAVLIVTTYVKDISGFTDGKADNELGNAWGAHDLGCQSAYLVLKAAELGLGTLIMGIRDAAKIREKLAIPEEEEIASVIAVGYKKGDVVIRDRKPLEEVLTFI